MALGYGSTGTEVKKMQQALNGLGAGLKVDGIWGTKTQAAYEKYGSRLNAAKGSAAAPTAAAGGVEYLRYTPLTEARKKEIAAAEVSPAYDAQLRELAEDYAQARQENENEALKRGMARSSYVLDVAASLDARQAEDKSAVESARAAKIQALIRQLTEKDEKAKQSALKYNNSLALQLEQMRQKLLKQQQDYALQLKKLDVSASKKRASRSSSSSRSASSGSMDYNAYYAKNYLAGGGNNGVVARALYYADRAALKAALGDAAVRQMDAIADRLAGGVRMGTTALLAR